MNGIARQRLRPDYGIDAPLVVRNLFLAGILGTAIAGGHWLGWWSIPTSMGIPLVSIVTVGGMACTLTALHMLWGSKFRKLRLRDQILNATNVGGDERVLDVGCGRGLMLIGAARRLTTGRAIGIDLWQPEDLSGNSPAATLANARIEGVAGMVELHAGDARQIPFADRSFDLILSTFALHNIYGKDGRHQALSEIVRVLKPGGRIAIADINFTREYVLALRRLGLTDVERNGLNFLFVIPTWTVQGKKPTHGG